MYDVPYNVKRALRLGNLRKNYKIKVYEAGGRETVDFTIDNDDLISESVKIDDRMCSGKLLKFGLCEGASCEFQYFNHPNINGRDIQVYCSVEYFDDDNQRAWYDIPMGWFTVDECPMQFSTGIYKAVAYNKLKSEYLDQKANNLIFQEFDGISNVKVMDVLDFLLNGYSISQRDEVEIPVSIKYDSGLSAASSFKYTQVTGDYYTPFNPCYPTVTTSTTNTATVDVTYTIWECDPTYPVKAKIGDNIDLDAMGNLIVGMIADNLDRIPKDATTESILTNMIYSGGAPNTYGFAFSVEHADSTVENYGMTNGGNTFADFFKKTHMNVSKITLCMFRLIRLMPMSITQGPLRLYGVRSQAYEWREETYLPIQSATYYYPDDIYHMDLAGACDSVTMYAVHNVSDADIIEIDPTSMADVTLRELQSSVYETVAQFGQLDRITDLFGGVELNYGGLLPAETLCPADGLYPNQGGGNNVIHPFPSEYQKLWTDTVGEQSFRYLIITYKGMVDDGNGNQTEADLVLQRTVNANGTTDYNMSDNWLFRNLVWSEQDVGDYADAMVLKMKDVRWFPFEMWAAGLPYVDVGDAIEIADRAGNTYMSYILQRQLNGIHNLQDTYINGELDVF